MDPRTLPAPVKGLLRYLLTLPIAARSYLLAPFGAKYRNVIALIAKNSKVGTWLGDVQPDWIPRLPDVKADALFKVDSVVVPFRAPTHGNVSSYELAVLAAMVRHFKPASIFEIGTFNGLTTLTMALNAPAGTRIHTLDLPAEAEDQTALQIADSERVFIRKHRSGELFQRGIYPEEKMITQVFGDSAVFDYAPYEGLTDLVFVDGSHAYDYVISDTQRALKLLRGGRGVIVWHDYNTYWPDVIRALEEFHDQPAFKGIAHIEGTSIAFLART